MRNPDQDCSWDYIFKELVMKHVDSKNKLVRFSIILIGCLFLSGFSFSSPVELNDINGKLIQVTQNPQRVVSLVPSVTEVIFKLGADESLKGITYHSTYPSGTSKKEVVGGFFSPSIEKIDAINPDLIFVSALQKDVIDYFQHKNTILVNIEIGSIENSLNNILLLGKLFSKEKNAEKLVETIKSGLRIVSQKISKIPETKRKRVIRLMGKESVMTPGVDSFQNEMIHAAGGITHEFGKKGNIISVTKEEWIGFNPEVIYGCGPDKEVAQLLNKPGWKDVEAVKNGKIYYFPCDLTCRASTNTDYFVSWLAATIYGRAFSIKEDQIFEDKVFKSRSISLDLDFLSDARIDYSRIYDVENKTLLMEFKTARTIVSTLEGQRDGITAVGNHYFPPPDMGDSS